MVKIMKKLMITMCSMTLVLSTMLTNVTASNNTYIYSDDSFAIKNEEAKQKLDAYLKKKDSLRNVTMDDGKILNSDEIYVKNISEFSELEKVADGNIDVTVLYTYEDENVKDVIAYDSTDSSYVMLEQDMVNNTATVTVNHDTYSIVQEDSNIYIKSKNGGILAVYEEFNDPSNGIPLVPAEGQDIIEVDDNTSTTRTSWVKHGGPFHKTSKMIFEVLEIIGYVGSAVSLFVSGPLGKVVFLSSIAVAVGKTISPTVHIKYYQYGASDCMTYIREERFYYGAYSEVSNTYYEQITNKNGTPKVTYSYFHSQRPDYTGNPACMGY